MKPWTDSVRPTFGTHIRLLKLTRGLVGGQHCVEFGPGPYSTPLLLENFAAVTSVEEDATWADEVRMRVGSASNLNLIVAPDPQTHVAVLRNLGQCDLLFVDGSRAARVDLVVAGLDIAHAVVAHDTNKPNYGWERLETLPAEVRFDDSGVQPWTSVFSRDPVVVRSIRGFFEMHGSP